MNSGTNMYQTVGCKPYGSCFMGTVSTPTDFSPKLSVVGRDSSFLYLYFFSSLRELSVLSGGVIYVLFYWIPPLCLNWIWQWCLVFLSVSVAALKPVSSGLLSRQSNTVEDIAKECDLWNHLACAILENEKARDWLFFLLFFTYQKCMCQKCNRALLNGKFLLRVNYSCKASQEVKRAHRTARARYRLFS